MNVKSTKKSNSQSPSTVVSKYFSRNRVMDDSLTDFKEKKSATKGPKTVQKSSSSKPKKNSKKIKGQKDIRTILKAKKNELIDYTKQFDDVCKVSGLDVETEQLLLAVALSKSLQKTNDTPDDNTPSSSQSSQGRINKIRTTLQEYGFTVPEIKISKKSRVCRKNYKLLLTTEIEKQQTISDKYAQILFDVCDYKLVEDKHLSVTNINLYYKATNIFYKDIRNNDVFYIMDFVEKSSSIGSLLRNWSDIPGRPSSPVYSDNLNMDFSEIECSQEELDVILSGSLKSCKSIMRNKTRRTLSDPVSIIVDECNNSNEELDNFNSQPTLNDRNSLNIVKETNVTKEKISGTSLNSSVIDRNSVAARSLTRSCSPDIFDDEASGIMENYEDNKDIVYTQIIDDIIEDNKTIDLTQNSDDATTNLKCSQNDNFTRRHSNDVMEITECVAKSAVTKSEVNNHGKKSPGINLTNVSNSLSQSFQISNKTKILNDAMEITDCVANISMKISKNMSVKANVDLTQDSDEDNDIAVIDSCPVLNKSHTSNSDDELPSVNVGIVASNNESLDATIILNADEINNALRPNAKSDSFEDKTLCKELNILRKTPTKVPDDLKSSQSFFDEFEHEHSDTTVENYEKSKSVEFQVCDDDENKIDLTQSSDDTIEKLSVQKFKPGDFGQNFMGKKDDISIDYDELCDNFLEKGKGDISNTSSLSPLLKVSIVNDDEDLVNSKSALETSNQNSIVFEICDQELNYSINKSDIPWVNFGGISVMDDLSKLENSKNPSANNSRMKTCESSSSLSKSMSDSFLPMVAIKGTNVKENIAVEKESILTPLKKIENPKTNSEATPVSSISSEYIIKTDQVTPILDYASMTTPDRNRELDKYGLKPFKRKRAIQILTHLYNQTHPLVESTEDMPSPSKRLKPNSPKKFLKSLKESQMVCNKENTLYGATKELPDIVAIECLEEDWVFQKREKAKLHTCRVPLHIAFHNYVSCRQLLREAILRYEPVNIDDIHKGLVAIGFRYDPKDLLKFMDKKCITVKTADNNGRNNRR